ncbi:ATP-binding protein [Streptomyces tendae]|uniref:ATP-binding protein n=1 Tax=Streptomyces tendae TaxID=1932 RepID=UPI00364DC9D5
MTRSSSAQLSDGRLRVGVWDSSPYVPAPFAQPPGDAESGRGLRLVQAYADSWGGWSLGDDVLPRGAGKLLWFEVRG